MKKRKSIRRFLSILLAAVLVLGDGSPLQVLAAAQEAFTVSESGREEKAAEESHADTVSGSDADGSYAGSPSGAEADSAGSTLPGADGAPSGNASPGANGGNFESDSPEANGDSSGNISSETIDDYSGNTMPGTPDSASEDTASGAETGGDSGDSISGIADGSHGSSVSGNDAAESADTVSGNDAALPGRAPERFYEESAPENYGELVAYDAYSRTYHVEGNRYVTVIGSDGSTYLDSQGRLQAVDNRLAEDPAASYSALGAGKGYVNRANDYIVSLQETVSEGGALYSVASGEHALWVIPTEGSFRAGVVRDNAIRYSEVFPGIDYQYTVLGDSIKEDIILLEPGEKSSFSMLVGTDGLKAALLGNTVCLYEEGSDPEREAVFLLEAPEMEDAAGEISFGVRLELAETEEGYLITAYADEDWLQAPERVYPVRIDPTAVQVGGSAIHIACAEEGSPRTVIGDNAYPYVGYDDGITSGNLAGFGTKHKNCRSYFQIDYDFAGLAAEAEIVSATFQVTQKTRWSKGTAEFGLYGVEEEWKVNRLNWENQLAYSHYFLDSQPASTTRGEALAFDVTEEVSAWINGTAENHGFVMKALLEAPNEETAAAGVKMQCEVFYNNASSRYAPKLVLSWTGEPTDLDGLGLDDTTIEIYPAVARLGDKSTSTLGVVAHGLAKAGSTVHYRLVNGSTGETEAETSLLYPDSALYQGQLPSALEYKRRLSNWQSEVFRNLVPGQVYYIEAYAEGTPGTADGDTADAGSGGGAGSSGTIVQGATVRSDSFLIYREGAFDLIPRIANHYGVPLDTVMADMRMQDCLTKEGNLIFLRNPENTAAYPGGELPAFYQAAVDGLLLGRAQHCHFGYEPVNLNTGNFFMQQTDASLEDIGGEATLERSYNSRAAALSGSLGYGWSFCYDERLGELADGSILWQKADGGILTFTRSGTGWQAPAGEDYLLEETAEGYTVTDLSGGEKRFFDSYGLLKALEDLQRNRTALTYDMDLRLCAVVTPSGKTFGIETEASGRIGAVTLPDGGRIVYAYDGAGNLASVTDPEGEKILFVYDENHYMTAWYDENGNRVAENTYDSLGRVTRQEDAEGGVVTLEYREDGSTRATDSLGNVTVYHYDSQYRTTLVEYPDGTEERSAYDGEGRLASLTDRTGTTTRYTYDGKGNLLSEEREDGSVRSYTWNDSCQPLSFTDYDGAETLYTYDEKNRPVSVTDPEGGLTVYAYDGQNRVVSVTDPEGNATSYTYREGEALPESRTDAAGNRWQYTYDAMNRQLTETDPLGNTSSRRYNRKGWLLEETDAAGNRTVYTFDPAGAVTAITDKNGQTSVFSYDRMNRMISGKDPLGNTLAYTYDAAGNRLTETDTEGYVTSYGYDAMGRVISVRGPVREEEGSDTAKDLGLEANRDAEGGEQELPGEVPAATLYTYDGADRILSVTDRTGAVTSYTYDSVTGALLTETDARGNVTVYENDACGRVLRVLSPDGSVVSYTYDRLGRTLTATDPLGMVTSFTYDGNGNVVSVREDGGSVLSGEAANEEDGGTAASGEAAGGEAGGTAASGDGGASLVREYTYEYDVRGLLVRTTDPLGGVCAYTYDGAGRLTGTVNELGGSTGYAYDALNRLTEATDALGGKQVFAYDPEGRLLSETTPEGRRTEYLYDLIGQLTKATDAAGQERLYTYDGISRILTARDEEGVYTSYRYDGSGNLESLTDALGNAHTYTYDGEGRLLTDTYPNGEREVYTYDGKGNLLTYTDRYGVVTTFTYDAMDRLAEASDTAGNRMSYAYDGAGNLVKQTDVLGRSALYTYDRFGRPVSVRDVDGAETRYGYDALDRLVSVTDPAGNITVYEYDAAGNLTGLTRPGEAVYAYTYDALNRLTEKIDPEGAATTFAYDRDGSLTGTTDGNGVKTSYAYDALARLAAYTDGNGGVTRYTYDLRGNLTAITTPEGITERYGYDAAGNLTAVTDGEGAVWSYTYDRLYRLVRSTSPLGAEETYTYDRHDVVTSVTDALGNVTLYDVNANGQVEEKILPNGGRYRYAYDAAQRLEKLTTPLGYETAFTYSDGDDILEQADSLGRVTRYAYDVLHNLTEVIDPEGGVTAYAYDARGNQVSVRDALNAVWEYGYDKLDRMTTVTDPEEKATAVVYDPAGNIESITSPGGRRVQYSYDGNYNTVSLTDPMGYVYGYTYDKDDRLTGTADPLGQTTVYRYDQAGRTVSYTDKMGLREEYTYDAHGNLLSRKDTGDLTTYYTYDLLDRLTSVTDPMGSTAYYRWDPMGNLAAVTDYLGRGTSYTYDLENNLTSITGPTGRQEGMAYDQASRLTSYTANSGKRIQYDYDKLDDLAEKAYTDATGQESAAPAEYTYDALGRRLTMTDSTGETVYSYDALGRLTEVTTYRKPAAGSNGAGNAWNGGNSTENAWNGGNSTGNAWNGGNSTGNAWNGGNGAGNAWNGAGNAWNSGNSAGNAGTNGSSDGSEAAENSASLFSHAEGSGDTIGYTYNEADDLAAITYPDSTKVLYEYDLNGNLTKVTGRRGEVTTYEYDALNRPVAEHRPNGISTYKTYNARNQIVELTNQCDDCGWVLGHYVYTYDNRGYIVAEHAEEAREMDPYGREPYASYKPEKQGENCDHGRNRSLAYRLLVTDNTFTYDDAGKLLTATEAEEGCSTVTVWVYSYDLMGNLTEKTQYQAAKTLLEETSESINIYNTTNILEKVSKMDAISSEKYAYNESNQLSEATICDGKTTKKVCYTYDEDGNLIQEYSPTDRSLTSYQYTVEDRLEAVYKGNSYNKTLQMAAAYDGDGNRVYQLNYNPEKDEDFSDYYCSYKNCDYNGTGIQLQAGGEVSQAEKDLIAMIKASGAVGNSSYELIEYLNDVNREYVEVLVEQNINGRTDTVYTYGNERISREMFNQTNRTAYYLYDPRGSVSGLTDAKAHLTKTYRYSANGELTYGSAKYENEYTYNGESYNPNIRSQYLRARYYSVVHASFLTEDSYLGNIAEPLTLNRYNYCVSSWVNYEDPSGNLANLVAGLVVGVVVGVVTGAVSGDWRTGVVAGLASGVGVATFGASLAAMGVGTAAVGTAAAGGTTLGTMMVAGGVSGLASTLTEIAGNHVLKGEQYTAKEVAVEAAKGTAEGVAYSALFHGLGKGIKAIAKLKPVQNTISKAGQAIGQRIPVLAKAEKAVEKAAHAVKEGIQKAENSYAKTAVGKWEQKILAQAGRPLRAVAGKIDKAVSAVRNSTAQAIKSAKTAWCDAKNAAKAGSGGTVWDNIKATQDCYPNTNIPKSFEIEVNGQKMWVHGNATEHMYDDVFAKIMAGEGTAYINPDLYTQYLMSDFYGSLEQATASGIKYGEIISSGNWEFIFAQPRQEGLLPVIKHAKFNGW
ncbi:MAG: DNRLRE domain-containing protein [Ruminococcus flavefaciens]|nr:DNRLRE domain-containing protein [Ruminococcus flavefaciens]